MITNQLIPSPFIFAIEDDQPISPENYQGDLPGEQIRHKNLLWLDTNGSKHTKSYNYNEHGQQEELPNEFNPKDPIL